MPNTTLSIAIMSGKGGVGKTSLALNLACALYQNRFKTLLIDCDLGLANLDVLLGITPEGNLQNVLLGDKPLEEVLYPVEKHGFDVLPAASGVPELVDMNAGTRDLLLRRLEPSLGRYDFVFMDLGAGISDTIQSFAAMAALRIVIVTPEPTSLTDSYAMIKVLNNRYGLRNFMVVVNEATSAKEAQDTFEKLSGACRHFIQFEPVMLGSIRFDENVSEAVCRQKPLMRCYPGTPAAQDIQGIAQRLQKARLNMLDWLGQRGILHLDV